MSLSSRLACVAVGFALLAPAAAAADTYTLANFSGAMNNGDANVKLPFRNNGFVQGQAFSGSFVYDNALVPGGGTGFVNVFDGAFPDIATIPADAAFHLNFGTLTFDASDNLASELLGGPGIQYNNGAFNGFQFVTNFNFMNADYRLRIDGGVLTVRLLSGGFPTGNNLINAHIDIGNGALTGGTPYTPPGIGPGPGGPGVPEPATWGLMILGFGGIGATLRRRRATSAFA